MKNDDNSKKIKIVLTGGHAGTTAIATAQGLISDELSWEIHWIGPRSSFEGKRVPTIESEVFPKIGVGFHSIISGRLQRRFTSRTAPSLVKVPFGFLHAFFLLLKIKPRVVVSFGGSVGLMVAVAAWLLRIPVIVHEQTVVSGLANRIAAFFANKVTLAREESRVYFPKEKVEVVGNPILSGILKVKPNFKLPKVPTIYITGGSRGSQRINDVAEKILETLLKDFNVIHQTGPLNFEKFSSLRSGLPNPLKSRYEVYGVISPLEIDKVYDKSHIVIGRGGANTVSEIIITKRPSILIPIPWVYEDEQTKNAKFAEGYGIAKVVPESELTRTRILSEIKEISEDWGKMVKRVSARTSPDKYATEKLVSTIKRSI